MNYANLVTRIENELSNEESSFVTHIPDFVQAAERFLYNTYEMPVVRKNVTGPVTVNVAYLTLPFDCIDIFSMAVIVSGQHHYLLPKEMEFIRESFPSPSTSGMPQYYADYDNDTLILGPTPDSNYNVELHYFAYPPSIVTASTSWLGDNYPEALLYAAVVEAYVYMKGEKDLIDEYKLRTQVGAAGLPLLAASKRNSYRRSAA